MPRSTDEKGRRVPVEPGLEALLKDPAVAQGRLLGEVWLDDALLGTIPGVTGGRVLVYSEPDAIDLLARRFMRGSLGTLGPQEESAAYDSAVETLEIARDEVGSDGPFLIVTDPMEEEDYYLQRGRDIYLVRDGFRVVQTDLSDIDEPD